MVWKSSKIWERATTIWLPSLLTLATTIQVAVDSFAIIAKETIKVYEIICIGPTIDWDVFMSGDTLHSWKKFKDLMLELEQRHIPLKNLEKENRK